MKRIYEINGTEFKSETLLDKSKIDDVVENYGPNRINGTKVDVDGF